MVAAALAFGAARTSFISTEVGFFSNVFHGLVRLGLVLVFAGAFFAGFVWRKNKVPLRGFGAEPAGVSSFLPTHYVSP